MFLHESLDFKAIIESTSRELEINPSLVEKDYWIMHCLWGLKAQNFIFYLKGGTSLSKGFDIINRFSEDIDLKIEPPQEMDVKAAKNQTKPFHIESRRKFYDYLKNKIKINGIIEVERDIEFDNDTLMSAGLRLSYQTKFNPIPGLKEGILLEVGFDKTAPNTARTISSWIMDKILNLDKKGEFQDNRALDIPCYLPQYTFVEKLQTISTKFRKQQKENKLPKNFLRHYYDIYKLLEVPEVLKFIGTPEYLEFKDSKFSSMDEKNLPKNEAFLLRDGKIKELFVKEFENTKSLYYKENPSFEKIMERIGKFLNRL